MRALRLTCRFHPALRHRRRRLGRAQVVDQRPRRLRVRRVDRNAGRERIYVRGKEPLLLEPRDPVLYCIQTLRDEAHRFAIGAHRAKRKKGFTTSPLDEVPGVGPARKRALLQYFGSAKAVSRAGIADLENANGISAQMAKTIYDYFHERG